MSIPNHIAKLREKTGHDLMLLPGVCALVLNDKGEILLQRRADSGRWGLPGGIMEPGEVPAPEVPADEPVAPLDDTAASAEDGEPEDEDSEEVPS